MQHTHYKAFGHSVVKTEVVKDEIIVDRNHEHLNNTVIISKPYNKDINTSNFVPGTFNHIWLVTKGKVSFVNLYTGATLDWDVGYCSLDNPMPVGFWVGKHELDSEFFCFSPQTNVDVVPIMPDVSTFKMVAGSSTIITEDTKLFVCAGQLQVENTSISSPTQLSISAGKTITATTDIYGFKYN